MLAIYATNCKRIPIIHLTIINMVITNAINQHHLVNGASSIEEREVNNLEQKDHCDVVFCVDLSDNIYLS